MLDRCEFPRQVGSLTSEQNSDVRKENCRNTNVDHIFGYILAKSIVCVLSILLSRNKTIVAYDEALDIIYAV